MFGTGANATMKWDLLLQPDDRHYTPIVAPHTIGIFIFPSTIRITNGGI